MFPMGLGAKMFSMVKADVGEDMVAEELGLETSRGLNRISSELNGLLENVLSRPSDIVPPPSHILLVVALQLVLQTLRRIIVEISVAGYPGTILKRARRLRHRRTRSGRIARIGTLYHVTGIVVKSKLSLVICSEIYIYIFFFKYSYRR